MYETGAEHQFVSFSQKRIQSLLTGTRCGAIRTRDVSLFRPWINANVTDGMKAQMGKDGQWKPESVLSLLYYNDALFRTVSAWTANWLWVLHRRTLFCCCAFRKVTLNSLFNQGVVLGRRASLSVFKNDTEATGTLTYIAI